MIEKLSGKPLPKELRNRPDIFLKLLDREDAEKSLKFFVRLFWPFVEPGRKLVEGWPLDAICEHLEAVTRGEILRLLINVPPGFMKSMLVNVFWPAWEWGPRRLSSMRYIAASYSQSLTVRDNVRFRNVIMSDLYREMWGDRFGPSADQWNIEKVANDKTGWKLATSVGGVGTGERGDRLLLDDPNSVKESESKAVIESTNQWFREVIPTRLNDANTGVIVVIQQRTGDDDVSGVILGDDLPYEHLMIPMRFDPARFAAPSTSIGWADPRGLDEAGAPLDAAALEERAGELAWAARFDPAATADLEKTLGPYAVAGQFQQSPEPRGGGIFKRSWWQPWPPPDHPEPEDGRPAQFPIFDYVCASLDGAFTADEENDPSALTVWGVWSASELPARIAPPTTQLDFDDAGMLRVPEEERAKLMLMYGWAKHLTLHGPPEERPANISGAEWNGPSWAEYRRRHWGLVEWVVWTCRHFRVNTLLIEDKANAHDVAGEIARLHADEPYGVEFVKTGRQDKVARALSVQHLFSNGIIYAPTDRAWFRPIEDEMAKFPHAARKDLTDSCVHALRHLRDRGLAVRKDEAQRAHHESHLYRRAGRTVAQGYEA